MKKNIFLYFIYCICFACRADAIELDWKNAHFESINYSRIPIDGGAALYTLPSKDTLKFKIQIVFPNSAFTMLEDNIVALDALADMLILGGFGNQNYAQIENELMQNGINLSTSLNSLGQLVVSVEALTEDFKRVEKIISNLILHPKFDPNALTLWKQQIKSQFINVSNTNTLGKQKIFINVESARLAFGVDHYFAKKLTYASPKYTQTITIEKVKEIYKKVLNRNGLNALLTGAYSEEASTTLTNLIEKIPSENLPILTWVPAGLQASVLEKISHKELNYPIKVGIIQKQDMTQCQVLLQLYYPTFGELNPIEKAQMTLLSEVYSSSGGVIGNDRFSNAMRDKSGLSYAPRGSFHPNITEPNTNLSAFNMDFQSPNERIYEAVTLAKKTWDDFIKNGINAVELRNTRSSVINSLLAKEVTVFDKSEFFFSKILHGKAPSVNPIKESLEALDNQKNIEQINLFLKNKISSNYAAILVIMGNPSKEQIEKLKTIPNLDIIEMKEVNSFL